MAVLLLVTLVVLATSAALIVIIVGTESLVSFLLAVYLVVWAEVVGVGLVLSIFHSFGRTGLLAGSLAVFLAAAGIWLSKDRPRPPDFFPSWQRLRADVADPVLGTLVGAAVVVLIYAVVVGVFTAQNEWDSLTYHLSRAAFWIQQGSVSYVPNVTDVRINGNPPNAEIAQAWTMLLAGNDRFVALPSLSAVAALMLGVYGIALRAGLGSREALFGALVFSCLPLVVLQSSTAMNDLVVASFFVVATYFAIGKSSSGALGAGLALGLAFGTKIAAPLLLPVYLLVVFVSRRRRFLDQVVIVVLGLSLGAVWYIVNLSQTRALDGGMTEATGQTADRQPALILTRAYQMVLESIELPGASPGRNLALIYVAAAALAIMGGIALLRARRRTGQSLVIASIIVCVVPLVLVAAGRWLSWMWRVGWDALGRDDLADRIEPFQLSTLSDSSSTWYGPVGALVVIGGIILALRSTGSSRVLRVTLATAPLIFLGVLAVGVPFDPWRGRFFVFPIALATAAWGLAYRFRALAWASVGLTVVTLVLVAANSYTKPLGVRLVAPAATASVFGKPRSRVQTWTRSDGTDDVVRYFEQAVPSNATVGLSLGLDDFSYPYFGAHLSRTVRFIGSEGSAAEDDAWIVEAPGHEVARCASAWETALTTDTDYRVLRRISPDTC